MDRISKYSFYIAIFFLIFCIIFYFEALKIQQTEMVSSVSSAPIIWPKSLLILLFIFNLYTVKKYFRKIIISELIPKTNPLNYGCIKNLKENKLLMVIVFIGIYVFTVDYVGTLFSSFLLIIALMSIFEEKRLLVIFAYSILLIIFTSFVFLKILYVPLPRGMGVFRIISLFFY
ncbi:MAG: tripartite tricarboxylate transporter TctB family protein [Atribacterota bacterium]|nr:tripartite tricarboxylate transporter TctB family protein [Atribacterota bacterium]